MSQSAFEKAILSFPDIKHLKEWISKSFAIDYNAVRSEFCS